MSDRTPLSTVEAFVLLKPMAASGRDTVKLAMMTLVAQGTVSVVQEERKVFGFTRRTSSLRLIGSRRILFPGARRLIDLVGPAGCTMAQFVLRVRRAYGGNFAGFLRREVRPALQGRGLLVPRMERVLLVFRRTTWHLTEAGERECARVERAMQLARDIPEFLDRDPAQAAAIAFSLGTAILLVPELKPHYRLLAQAMRDHDQRARYGGDGDGSTIPIDLRDLAGEPDPDGGAAYNFDSLNLADFDAGAFDAFDSGLDAFDSGFDSSDGGNGDGGGNGGNGGC